MGFRVRVGRICDGVRRHTVPCKAHRKKRAGFDLNEFAATSRTVLGPPPSPPIWPLKCRLQISAVALQRDPCNRARVPCRKDSRSSTSWPHPA
eukprot:10817605-Alexandrium_andersonii.AAC.1